MSRPRASARTVELVRTGSSLQVAALASLDREHVSANGFLGPFAKNEPDLGLTGPWYTEGIVGLGASLNVDTWGKQRAQIAASLGVSNARLAETSAVELEFSTDVAQIYYGIQTTYQLIDLLNESHEVATFAVQVHEARAARGVEARTPLEEARAQQLAIERQIVSAQEQVKQFRESMRALVGAGPNGLPAIEPVALPRSHAALPATLSYEPLARRPDSAGDAMVCGSVVRPDRRGESGALSELRHQGVPRLQRIAPRRPLHACKPADQLDSGPVSADLRRQQAQREPERRTRGKQPVDRAVQPGRP
jgi:outer membrane protein TolC